MARRKSPLSFNLDVDERTSGMSAQALVCRSRGHKWGDRGTTRKRYNELLMQGLFEDNYYCENGCGGTWTILWSLRNGEILENKRTYPKDGDYLMPKGEGRLNRNSARVARASRELAALVP